MENLNKKEVTYEQIENLTKDVLLFVKNKGFKVFSEFEFLTRIEKVLYEEIDKNN